MSGGKIKKLTVVSYDEVHHPTIRFIAKTSAKDDSPSTKDALPLVNHSVATPQHQRRRRRSLTWTSRLGTLATASIMVIAIVLAGLRLMGFRVFTVLSGSMEPYLPVGSMIYVRPVDYQSLKVGDVISYVADDNKTVITHRIADIETEQDDASVRRFKTKGDANASADSKLVHYKNVLGTPIIILPLIGYFVHNIQEPPGLYITLVVGTLLLAWTFLPGTLEERRKTAKKSTI